MSTTFNQYVKRPIKIEAIQWTGENIVEVREFMLPREPTYMARFIDADEILGIYTLEGLMVARKGDWIIRGIKGELYPCKPDIFEATYEPRIQ